MRIDKLEWDDYRIEHIALHDVEPDEVWEVGAADTMLSPQPQAPIARPAISARPRRPASQVVRLFGVSI